MSSTTLNRVLWGMQGLLALVFVGAGAMKTFTPADELAAQFPLNLSVLRLAGVSELFGAVGLVLPMATGIQPLLTPLAAACLGVTMVLAVGTHTFVLADGGAAPSAVLGVLCFAVAWGRRNVGAAAAAKRSQ